ncbi:MAG: phosphatase PAP2 family protein [Chloroflexota bacterium]|nr:phosphatase PAP2 family protein [Chloroflexota bacterium]MDE2895325.1 phosphatase PAP2 family protein [Chloroflexota bacterium]
MAGISRRDVIGAVCWAALAVGVLGVFLRQIASLDPVAFAPISGVAVVAVFVLARRWGDWGILVAYVVAMGFFIQLRDAADETGLRTLTDYVLDWELWMFAGITPSAWLQARIGGASSDPGFPAFFSAIIHWTWFVFPHAAVLGTWLFIRRMAWRVTIIVALTFYLGAVLYFTVPTAPPWMAADQGFVDGIVRGMNTVGPALLGVEFYNWAFEAMAEPNPTAAMPSLHFAASFVVVGVGILLRSRWVISVAVLYSIALAFSLVYLGEHYIADIIAGAAVALIAFSAVEGGRYARAQIILRREQLTIAGQRAGQWVREALRFPPRRIEAG